MMPTFPHKKECIKPGEIQQKKPDPPGCSKGYVEDSTNDNTLCLEGAWKLVEHWNEKFVEACPTGTASQPGHHWTDQTAQRIINAFNTGTTTERDLENVAGEAIRVANATSVADCHNSRNLSVKECAPGSGAPDCKGPVAVCTQKNATATLEERTQRDKYVSLANNQVEAN